MYLIGILCLPFLLLIVVRAARWSFFWQDDEEDVPAENPKIQKFLRVSGVIVLAVGALAAALVYAHTQPSPGDDDDIVAYRIEGGRAFPVKASEDKAYIQSLKATGGNWDLLTDQTLRWIVRRWHGRNLATTLVVLSAAGCLGCFYLARKF